MLSSQSYGKTYFNDCSMSRGAIGCTLSHLSVLQDAYDSGYPIIWVLEDDFFINKDPHLLGQSIDTLDALVGKNGWDVLYTDVSYPQRFIPSYTKDIWRPDVSLFPDLVRRDNIGKYFIQVRWRARTHSMVIRRSGMKKILDFLKERHLFSGYDNEIFLVPGIKIFELKDSIVGWRTVGNSDIAGKK
jgi:GR25 family glycosyltransferase involved in LPS biosynthesis